MRQAHHNHYGIDGKGMLHWGDNTSGHKWSMLLEVLKSHQSKMSITHGILKNNVPSAYYRNGFILPIAGTNKPKTGR